MSKKWDFDGLNTYEALAEFLGGKQSRPMEGNTIAVNCGEVNGIKAVAVRLYSTDVVTLHENGAIVLQLGPCSGNGDSMTTTTKDRINRHLPRPWQVYTEGRRAHLWNINTGQRWLLSDAVMYIEIDADGTPCHGAELLPPRKIAARGREPAE